MMKAEVVNYLFSEMDEHWIESKKSATHSSMLPVYMFFFVYMVASLSNFCFTYIYISMTDLS